MADVYRTGKVLIINGVVTPPGTIVANAQTVFMHLSAMVSANELIHTTTSVTESNKTAQFIPTADEINWRYAPFGPEPKRPSVLVSQIAQRWDGDSLIAGAGVLTGGTPLLTLRATANIAGASTVVPRPNGT